MSWSGFLRQLYDVSDWGRSVEAACLTDPIADPCDLLQAFELVLRVIFTELLALHHDLKPLGIALNVKEHQLGPRETHRANSAEYGDIFSLRLLDVCESGIEVSQR